MSALARYRLAREALARSKYTAVRENRYANKLQPIPAHEPISVSRALESAVADSCIARLARRLGDFGADRHRPKSELIPGE